MSGTLERIDALAGQVAALESWTGFFDRELLLEWLRLEFGDAGILDSWMKQGGIQTKAVPFSPVLHVVSGNTPHAAFQSVLRGLLVGCRNRVKLPSAGLPTFEKWIGGLPSILAELVEIRYDLPEDWLKCEAAVIFGGTDTIRAFREKLPPETQRIEHGPKLSIGLIFEASGAIAGGLAEDILRHDQRGCLSIQAVYVKGDREGILRFGDQLAVSLETYRRINGRGEFTLSDSGAVSNAREIARFRESNGDAIKLWHSSGSTDWTIVFDEDPKLLAGPLNGFVRLHPMPENLGANSLGSESAFISTVAIHPFSGNFAEKLESLSPPRICEVGKAQDPTIFWHHDGMPALASLVRWRDLG